MSKRIVVFGNSHTEALNAAAQVVECIDDFYKVEFLWLKTSRHGRIELNDALEIIRGLAADDVLAVTYLGTMHNRLGMFEHEHPIGIIHSIVDTKNGDFEIIPAALMKQYFAERVSHDRIVSRIAKLACCRVVHFPPPPPKRNMGADTKRLRKADGTVVEMKFAQPELRLALREMELETVSGYLNQLGVTVLSAPAEALDEDGFLKAPYAAKDITHAGAAYGALVLQQISDVIQKGTAAAGESRS